MTFELRDIIGFRGEKITELLLTDYSAYNQPLFRPGFLGDKWPAIDFYVELNGVQNRTPFFFIQTKATQTRLTATSKVIKISSKKTDIERLVRLPGPTYLFGVHEPTERVFVKAVLSNTIEKAITKIPVTNELTPSNLDVLYNEVSEFWQNPKYKPDVSVFA